MVWFVSAEPHMSYPRFTSSFDHYEQIILSSLDFNSPTYATHNGSHHVWRRDHLEWRQQNTKHSVPFCWLDYMKRPPLILFHHWPIQLMYLQLALLFLFWTKSIVDGKEKVFLHCMYYGVYCNKELPLLWWWRGCNEGILAKCPKCYISK